MCVFGCVFGCVSVCVNVHVDFVSACSCIYVGIHACACVHIHECLCMHASMCEYVCVYNACVHVVVSVYTETLASLPIKAAWKSMA